MMSVSRRSLLKKTLVGAAAAALPLDAFKFLNPEQAKAALAESPHRWGFLVDTTKCVGCGFCDKIAQQEPEQSMQKRKRCSL